MEAATYDQELFILRKSVVAANDRSTDAVPTASYVASFQEVDVARRFS
jgi:hypothetical protein